MNAYEWVSGQPWAITAEALQTMIDIVDRHPEMVTQAMTRSPEDVSMRDGDPLSTGGRGVKVRDGVAVLPVRGPISRYMGLFDDICGGTSSESLAKSLQAAVDAPEVRSILLDIDSPGGQAHGSYELAEAVRAASSVKPVTAYSSGLMCSAAYHLASAASEVVVHPTAIVGSIGTLAQVDTRERKVKVIRASQSPLKALDPATKEGESEIQKTVDAMASEFVADVARYRNVTPEKVLTDFGRGGTMLGRAAMSAGMVDGLGTFEGTLAALAAGKRVSDTGKTVNDETTPSGGSTRTGVSMNKSFFARLLGIVAAKNPEMVAEAMDDDLANTSDEAIAGNAALVEKVVFDADAERARIEADVMSRLSLERRADTRSALEASATAWTDGLLGSKVKPEEIASLRKAYVVLGMADFDTPDMDACLDILTGLVESRDDSGLISDAIPEEATEAPDKLAGFKVLPEAVSENDRQREDAALRELLESTELGRASIKKS
jgi:capsid assembly protease